MRQKKLRGYNRRIKHILNWKNNNSSLNLSFLEEYERDYVKFNVSPWSNLSISNSAYPEPKGRIKQLILKSLIDIYNSFKIKLDSLNEPYYLKIWLYEPRFTKSQVVCAFRNNIQFYDNVFYKPEYERVLNTNNFGDLKHELDLFKWKLHLDEDHFDNLDMNIVLGDYDDNKDYLKDLKYFSNLLKQPHRKIELSEPIGNCTISYYFKRGNVWIGEINI